MDGRHARGETTTRLRYDVIARVTDSEGNDAGVRQLRAENEA